MGLWSVYNTYLSCSFLFHEHLPLGSPPWARVPARKPAHAWAPLPFCSSCQETCGSTGSPWAAASFRTHPPDLVQGSLWTSMECLTMESLLWCLDYLLTLLLHWLCFCRAVYFPPSPLAAAVQQILPLQCVLSQTCCQCHQSAQLWPVAGSSWSLLELILSNIGAPSIFFSQKPTTQHPLLPNLPCKPNTFQKQNSLECWKASSSVPIVHM